MSQQELLRYVVTLLDKLGIDYMVTGSFASSMHGEARMTHDIDLVVALTRESAEKLFHAFPEREFYLSLQAIQEALEHRTMFNLLQAASGDKVDFWILTDEPFDVSCFARKRPEESAGIWLKTSTPEDTILAKLRVTQQCGGSEKHC